MVANKHLVDGKLTCWGSWNYGIKPRTLRKWVTKIKKEEILNFTSITFSKYLRIIIIGNFVFDTAYDCLNSILPLFQC